MDSQNKSTQVVIHGHHEESFVKTTTQKLPVALKTARGPASVAKVDDSIKTEQLIDYKQYKANIYGEISGLKAIPITRFKPSNPRKYKIFAGHYLIPRDQMDFEVDNWPKVLKGEHSEYALMYPKLKIKFKTVLQRKLFEREHGFTQINSFAQIGLYYYKTPDDWSAAQAKSFAQNLLDKNGIVSASIETVKVDRYALVD